MGFIYGYVTQDSKNVVWEGSNRQRQGVGRIKVGHTDQDVKQRIKQQQTNNPHGPHAWELVLIQEDLRQDGTTFNDKLVHRTLRKAGLHVVKGSEWVEATPIEIEACIEAIKCSKPYVIDGSRWSFPLRPEQEKAIKMTLQRYKEQTNMGLSCTYLWNAKMRFGKSFAALKLAIELNAKRVLVITWIPSVQNEWYGAVTGHGDFESWRWTEDRDAPLSHQFPSIHFASAQGLFKLSDNGEKRRRNIKSVKWDLLIIDEQHWGADKNEGRKKVLELDLKVAKTLELSGTPFGDLESGYFSSEDTFTWSYTDEQQSKKEWHERNEDDAISKELTDNQDHPKNPWHGMPRMQWRVYSLNETLGRQLEAEDSWTLQAMFATKTDGSFRHEELVLDWLRTISRECLPSERYYPYERRLGGGPFENAAKHSVWVFNNISQCKAMERLVCQVPGFAEVTTINASGSNPAISAGKDALELVRKEISDSEFTLTLTCGMLLVGVTVPEWGVIGMLQSGDSMSSYLQAAFRVQSPYITGAHVHKPSAFVFDFEPNRSLKVISKYADTVTRSKRKITDRQNSIENLCRFIEFIWHEDGSVNRLNPEQLLIYSSETIGKLYMAKRWASGRFVKPDAVIAASDQNLINILNRVPQHKRTSKNESEITISSNPDLAETTGRGGKKSRLDNSQGNSDAKRKRRKIQEKLTKLLSCIPMFMYLTEERERALVDVIESTDTHLFEQISKVTLQELRMLRDVGAYDEHALNKAVVMFRNQEAQSLGYLGVNPPAATDAGWSDST